MKYKGAVRDFAEEHGLWKRIVGGIQKILHARDAERLVEKLSGIPVKESRATRRLGSYSARGDEPVCIRLQFCQESELLLETFLHEVAHACHHLTAQRSVRRLGHGEEWKRWARAFDISVRSSGKSESLSAIYRGRIKVVAVCRRCGATIQRIRRLDRRRNYIHPSCGGEIVPIYD